MDPNNKFYKDWNVCIEYEESESNSNTEIYTVVGVENWHNSAFL